MRPREIENGVRSDDELSRSSSKLNSPLEHVSSLQNKPTQIHLLQVINSFLVLPSSLLLLFQIDDDLTESDQQNREGDEDEREQDSEGEEEQSEDDDVGLWREWS
jgi:hypothetical protein